MLRELEHGRIRQPRARSVRGLADALGLGAVERDALLAVLASTDSDDRLPRVGVLGPLVVSRAGVGVDVRSQRQRTLLGLLALHHGQAVPVSEIVDVLWGERPPRTVRNLVQMYVGELRALLGAASVLFRTGGYVLELAARRLDLAEFDDLATRADRERTAGEPERALESLVEALRCWRGGVLADAETRLRQHPRAVAAEQARIAAAVALAELATGLDRSAVAADLLPAVCREAPLHEELHARWMTVLAHTGQQAEALKVFAELRDRLVTELGVEPGARLRSAHLAVLRGRHETTTTVVPRQLPAPPRWFTGRTDDLATLTTALDHQGTVVISVISGAGGIGKTWLALHWAHEHTDRFPDGQLFVDLRGFSPDGTPLNPSVAVCGFLGALGADPASIPTDLDAQAALYRSVVAGKRLLVVLDNAATADQVLPLLPGTPTCTVLVTSRRRLDVLMDRHGARHLHLGILPWPEACALLAGRLGDGRTAADPDAADELIELCGRYPLALSIIARYSTTHPTLTLSEVAAELHELGLDMLDNDDPAASLPAVLSWSLRHLTAEQRTVFAMLGLVPGPDISLPAAVALTGLPATRTRMALHALENASLVDRHPHGRYAMHDLIRDYAAGTARSTTGGDVALRRLADFYLHTTVGANRLLSPDSTPFAAPLVPVDCHPLTFRDAEEAWLWLDDELPCLLAIADFAIRAKWHTTVWQMTWALDTFLYRRGCFHDRLACWQAALTAAEHLRDTRPRGWAHRGMGQCNATLNRHPEALTNLRHALALAEQAADLVLQAEAQHTLGWTWHLRGDNPRALEHATRALELARRTGDPTRKAHMLGAVGWYSTQLGRYEQARAYCAEALVLTRAHRDRAGEANVLDSLGYLAHRTGDHARAVNHYNEALAVYRALGNAFEQADTQSRLGEAHAALDQHAQARAAWLAALESYRTQGRHEKTARTQRQLDALDTGS